MERYFFKKISLNLLLMTLISLSLFACSNETPKEGVEVTDAWVRKMPPGVTNTAAFMTIKNHTGSPVTLTGVAMDNAGHVMMHETKVVNDMAKMEHLDKVVIDKEVSFKPGAKHVMIMGLDMSDGADRYNIRLHFENKPSLDVSAQVRDANQ